MKTTTKKTNAEFTAESVAFAATGSAEDAAIAATQAARRQIMGAWLTEFWKAIARERCKHG